MSEYFSISKIQIFSIQGAQQSEQEGELEGEAGLLHHPRRIRGHAQRGQGGSGHGPEMITLQKFVYIEELLPKLKNIAPHLLFAQGRRQICHFNVNRHIS